MKRFYSASTGCTYLAGLSTAVPADAVEISEDVFLSVIANPAPGKIRGHDASGLPVLIDPPQVIPDYVALIADVRYQHEIGGIVLAGMSIDTDDRSKTLISGSALKAMRDSGYVLRWKTPNGFVDLPATQVLMIADAVSDHVQACFNRESTLLDALAAGTFAESMLAEGWPA